ncbi:type II secretion system protein [Paraclostridium bifermentans]|uniref:type II secretion system protein n=1 Tax=Paraclostridium bifermentans TaxID=1490 RepID=UPI00359C2324
MLKKTKNNKGFTLIELLVVIAIIGILAVVAVPALFNNINKAKVADLKSDYNAYKSASLAYYTDENSIPTKISDLNSYMDNVPETSPFGQAYILKPEDGNLYLETTTDKASELKDKLESDSNGTITVEGNNIKMKLISDSMVKGVTPPTTDENK